MKLCLYYNARDPRVERVFRLPIHLLQHVPFETPGDIVPWAKETKRELRVCRVWQDSLPRIERGDGLIVMGGPMSVHDEDTLPWLAAEKALIGSALAVGIPTLGICLGAQLIADVLGATVSLAPKREIGWFPVRFEASARDHEVASVLPPEMNVFHWHGETFSLPPNTRRLGSSDACENQGFLRGNNVVALQFHMEVTAQQLQELEPYLKDEDTTLPYVQTPTEILASRTACTAANSSLRALLNKLFQATS